MDRERLPEPPLAIRGLNPRPQNRAMSCQCPVKVEIWANPKNAAEKLRSRLPPFGVSMWQDIRAGRRQSHLRHWEVLGQLVGRENQSSAETRKDTEAPLASRLGDRSGKTSQDFGVERLSSGIPAKSMCGNDFARKNGLLTRVDAREIISSPFQNLLEARCSQPQETVIMQGWPWRASPGGQPVYHSVYHDSRQSPLSSVSTVLEQKEKPLKLRGLADDSW
jgi:hypothetical protein